ncbi:MAG TPA: hypothetical protein VF625_10885 [Longimicrobium sp.]|jgi:hypothetical protein
MRTPTLILAASILTLAACSDGPGPSATGDASWTSFTYAGPKSGSFEVMADPDPGRFLLSQTFAFGVTHPDDSGITIQSVLQRPGGRADWMTIEIPTRTAGVVTIDSESCPAWQAGCPNVFVAFDLPTGEDGAALYSCRLATGTMRVTAVTAERAAGEFSGTGTCFVEGRDDEPPFSITGGRFDVKLAAGARADRWSATRPVLPG